jgi:antirestriction protein ArdC
MKNTDVYKRVTDRIVEQLEAGVAPWKKPWRTFGGVPTSLSTGRPYRGVNVLLLTIEGYADPRWGTYKAIKAAGGQVRKGEKGTYIILWKPVTRRAEGDGEEDSAYMLLRMYSVFNATQADGLPELEREEREFTPIEAASKIVQDYAWVPGPPLQHGYDQASYSPTRDIVSMPDPQVFESDEAYYSTLFHELVHSTGHEKRLARIEPALFGTDPYGKEELVAEMGAAFLAGIAEFEEAGGAQSAAYIAGWLERVEKEPRLVVQAAAQAQKAVDLMLGTSWDSESAEAHTALAA